MQRITDNFRLSEFASKCGREMPLEVRANIQKLANQLQVIRNEIGQPITITSGWRSPEHTRELVKRGIKTSLSSHHVFGKAVDFKVANRTPKQVAEVIERLILEGKILQGGVGVYRSWIHYDIRKTRARW